MWQGQSKSIDRASTLSVGEARSRAVSSRVTLLAPRSTQSVQINHYRLNFYVKASMGQDEMRLDGRQLWMDGKAFHGGMNFSIQQRRGSLGSLVVVGWRRAKGERRLSSLLARSSLAPRPGPGDGDDDDRQPLACGQSEFRRASSRVSASQELALPLASACATRAIAIELVVCRRKGERRAGKMRPGGLVLESRNGPTRARAGWSRCCGTTALLAFAVVCCVVNHKCGRRDSRAPLAADPPGRLD